LVQFPQKKSSSMLNFVKSLAETILSFYFILKLSNFKIEIKKIKKRYQEIIVLGNGPSLKKDLQENRVSFENCDTLCVNNFAASELYVLIKPSIYVFMDSVYWENAILEDMRQQVEATFKQITDKTDWPLTIFFPYQAKGAKRLKLLNNSMIQIIYVNAVPVTGFQAVRVFFYKRNLGMPPAQNVMVAALYIALNLGYKKLFLLGADHSWHKNLELDAKNTVCFIDHHFYDKEEATLIPVYKGTADNSTFTMRELFSAMALMFKGYEMIEQYACSLQSKIYNLSSITYIDAFERREGKS